MEEEEEDAVCMSCEAIPAACLVINSRTNEATVEQQQQQQQQPGS
jgi:hypothetical protein